MRVGLEGDDMNELDKYMADPPLRLSGHFDILAWWKNQIDEYPVLAKIARDLLAVQVSTVASESAFSAGGRVVDPFRSRLDPEMVQALICMKDWVAAGRRGKRVGSIVGDLEVIEVLAEKLKREVHFFVIIFCDHCLLSSFFAHCNMLSSFLEVAVIIR